MSFKMNRLICSLFFVIIACPAYAMAEEVTCESMGGDKNYCDMDTSGGVRIYKNLSKTDCIQGQNWGEGRHGVWVKDGCRAVFISQSRHGRYEPEEDQHRDYRRDAPAPAINCPPGTHVSTHRCTQDERRRGCKDYGAGNGMGCSNF